MTEETGNPWQEWLAQQSPIKGLPKRITIMHKMYGISAGHTCGKCALMLRRKFSATYLKCSRSTMTRGAAHRLARLLARLRTIPARGGEYRTWGLN